MPIVRNLDLMSIPALMLSMAFPFSVSAAPMKNASKSSPAVPTETVITMPARPKPLLDTATIRRLYMDGEFDQATEILETGLNERRPFNHEDSVFIFKHLGVMYAAKYETRERGKYFMHQLLMTEPTAKIMDMYASDMIYMIFKNIQDEFEQTRGKLGRAEDHVRENGRTNADGKPPRTESGKRTLVWVGATTAIVAAGVAAYFLIENEPKNVTVNSSFE